MSEEKLEKTDEKPSNVEIVDFKKKDSIEAASERVTASAKAANAQIQSIDEALDVEDKLPEIGAGEVFVSRMDESEIDMFRQMLGIGTQLKKDLDAYQKQADDNIKKLFNDDPEKISAFLIKKALFDEVDRNLINRLCRNKELYDLLRKTMFWRIQERTGVFDFVLEIRKNFEVVQVHPVHIMQVEEAANRLKKLHALQELEKSNHPYKHIIKQMLEDNIF